MAKLSRELTAAQNLHPRENLFVTGSLAASNAELIVDCDGSSSVFLDLRGTFSLTVELSGTIDGVNWNMIPVKNILGGVFLISIAGTTAGIWKCSCAGYRKVRARVTAYTSGSATAYLMASASPFDDYTKDGGVAPLIVTATGAAGSAVTVTLTAPGVGLRHYITYISINRFAAALLVAAATPVVVTTTNLPGSLAFSRPADAAAQGTLDSYREDFAFPIMSSAQNANTTIVCPATTNVIWRATVMYYVAP